MERAALHLGGTWGGRGGGIDKSEQFDWRHGVAAPVGVMYVVCADTLTTTTTISDATSDFQGSAFGPEKRGNYSMPKFQACHSNKTGRTMDKDSMMQWSLLRTRYYVVVPPATRQRELLLIPIPIPIPIVTSVQCGAGCLFSELFAPYRVLVHGMLSFGNTKYSAQVPHLLRKDS
jgi:hypothetical protein